MAAAVLIVVVILNSLQCTVSQNCYKQLKPHFMRAGHIWQANYSLCIIHTHVLRVLLLSLFLGYFRTNTSKVCEGRGQCLCGKCECQPISSTNSSRRYSGDFCECNNYGCDYSDGELCGGQLMRLSCLDLSSSDTFGLKTLCCSV